jgi:hypothetical protein
MTVKQAIAAIAWRIADVKTGHRGRAEPSLLRERRKLPFAWLRLERVGERFSIVEEPGPPQDRGRGATAPRFVCQPPGPSLMM